MDQICTLFLVLHKVEQQSSTSILAPTPLHPHFSSQTSVNVRMHFHVFFLLCLSLSYAGMFILRKTAQPLLYVSTLSRNPYASSHSLLTSYLSRVCCFGELQSCLDLRLFGGILFSVGSGIFPKDAPCPNSSDSVAHLITRPGVHTCHYSKVVSLMDSIAWLPTSCKKQRSMYSIPLLCSPVFCSHKL